MLALRPSFSVVFVRCHFVSVVGAFGLVALWQKLGFSLGLCGFANVPPNEWG
jgi:hypothetical protein